jgi:rfaE bifunctional protein nucleotidyltransferase chain/domain
MLPLCKWRNPRSFRGTRWRRAHAPEGRGPKKLVFTNGAFDILHAGHVTYLQFARSQGDALCVGLNSDASVKRYKGDKRPVNPQADRARVLAALACVDYVVVFDEDEPKELIGEIIPDVLVKGADWAHYVSGRDIVEAHGGKVVLADVVAGRSTTNTIERIVQAYGSRPGSKSESQSESESKSSAPSFTPSAFGHERLDCYRLGQDFLAWLKRLEGEVSSPMGDLKSQLERASLSMVLNTAEGNGKRERPLRARFFDDARGSAAECAACLDVLVATQGIAPSRVEEGKLMLNRIAAMLTGLVERYARVSSVREGAPAYGAADGAGGIDSDCDSDCDSDRRKTS